ncbi:hypothetical protein L6452_08213 [Arctium lappa]|uniref:Uncharacterized protein n=1 Tax=Arctium lappa TaxID=4217 RepID=A0ACB9DHG5_ARCLA|nr:hypothetical protein L6452_08213 [Arctium lappa]
MLRSVVKAILFCLLSSVYLCSRVETIDLSKNVPVSAVLAFGGSSVDQGNNNYIETLVKANFPPYGKDFQGGRPTGRFSNGRTIADILGTIPLSRLLRKHSHSGSPHTLPVCLIHQEPTEALVVKEYLPAYLDPFLQDEDLLSGVSFASGGSGFDNLTARITEIYELGARKIAFFSAPPIGCFPSVRTIAGGVLRSCKYEENEAAQLFNSMLKLQLQVLSSSLPHSRVAFVDFYNPLISIIENPNQYGIH